MVSAAAVEPLVPVLELVELSKSYGSRAAVQRLNLTVRRGDIYGFLGPNGAGKTTTIRMALGLITPTSGTIRIMGEDVQRRGGEVLPRVGALVDSPAFYPYLSGRDNLVVFGTAVLGRPRQSVDDIVRLVGLAGRERDRVGTYSLGMKQRLALGLALLGDPDLLVLDEPTNGLDPAGIAEIRELMRRLAARDQTIFVSSHQLKEVQEVCTRVAILDHGRLLREASVEELTRDGMLFDARVTEPAGALAAVRLQPWGRDARLQGDVLVTSSPTGHGRDLWRFLESAGFPPDSLSPRRKDLEEVFLRLTSPDQEPK